MNSHFDFKHLKGDVFGGITAGIVALPLALAFGVSSGMGPSAGLYGAIFVSFFAALFGGTNTQISGPTAPMTAVSMVLIASILALNGGDLSKSVPLILFIFFFAGLLQIGLGIIGIGSYIKFIPNPVVSGFMTAIGVIILVTQIAPTLGYYPKEDVKYVSQFTAQAEEKILEDILKAEVKEGIMVLETFEVTIAEAKKILDNEAREGMILKESKTLAGEASSGVIGTFRILPNALSNINWLELSLALGTVVIIFGFNRITSAIPSTLVALLVMSGIAYGFGLDYRSIDAIPSGLPVFNFEIFTEFDFANVPIYLFTALTLALLGSIDSLLTSVVADNLTRTRHQSNKELIGQGIGNSIAALFGGLPGAGATIRTVINIKSGAKTRLSGMISGVLLLVILVALSPIASKIPAAVLAGILITVGIGVMDYKGLKAIPNMPRFEVIIMLVVLVLSAVWNLVFAVGIGLVIASIMFMKEIGDLTSKGSSVKSIADDQEWSDETGIPISLNREVFIKHLNGPLFFGSTSDFQELSRLVPHTATAIIIRMDNVTYIDQSGKFVMEDILMNWVNEGKQVLLVGLLEQPRYMLERINIIPQLVPEEQLFRNFKDCAAWIKENIKAVV